MDHRLPLDGVTVVAIEQAVAAPFCTSRLADAGARVIKIERPEGDFARGYDDVASGLSSYFVWLNRGKESVSLDLSTAIGKLSLHSLIKDADIVIQNLKPGALDRLGFGAKKLREQFPKLIVCSISGYGDSGPMADRKAYDLLIQAESGLASVTGSPDRPGRVGISIVDIATGATAHAAILEALVGRALSGQGADIRISMFDVMADWLAVPLLHHEDGRPVGRLGLAHPSIAPYGVFSASNGEQILLSIQSDREWRKFSEVLLGDVSRASDERLATNKARVANRALADGLVERSLGSLTGWQVRAKLAEADIAFASLNDMAALSEHPHLRRITVDTTNGPVRLPAPAAIIVGSPREYGPVPALDKTGEGDPA